MPFSGVRDDSAFVGDADRGWRMRNNRRSLTAFGMTARFWAFGADDRPAVNCSSVYPPARRASGTRKLRLVVGGPIGAGWFGWGTRRQGRVPRFTFDSLLLENLGGGLRNASRSSNLRHCLAIR
jgi:hypothetical protein